MMTSGDYFSGIILPPFADLFPKTISICQTAKFPAILIFAAFPALLPRYCAARYRTSIEKVSGRNTVFHTSFHTSSHASSAPPPSFRASFRPRTRTESLRPGRKEQTKGTALFQRGPGPDSLSLGHPLFFGLKKSPALNIR